MTMTPVEVMTTVYEHMRRGEWDEAETYISDDFIVYEPDSLPYGGEWKGKDVFRRLFPAVMGSFDDPAPAPVEMTGGKEWANYIVNLTVTSKKTGIRTTYRVVESARVIDGKMTEMYLHYFDTAQMVKDFEGET